MKRIFAIVVLGAVLSASAENGTETDRELWRIGTADGKSAEFIDYYAWEYGHAGWLKDHPAMDHRTHTFTYKVVAGADLRCARIPSEICTRYENLSMPDDEIVTGLKVKWDEVSPGRRLFKVSCSSYAHWTGNGRSGIELQLADGRKKVYNLPQGSVSNRKDAFTMEVVVPVRPGENEVTVRIVTLAKHYRISFDTISLHATDRADDLSPVLEGTTDGFSGIYHPGDAAHLDLGLFNATSGEARYVVRDIASNVVAEGVCRLPGRVTLPTARKGWFSVAAEGLGVRTETAYCVVEPPEDRFIDDSRFGCHAIAGDGYFLKDTALLRERAEIKARRAFLGGAKWARLHYLSWACREPERGRYDWSQLDERLALAERNKLRVLFNVVEIPKWCSPTNDMKLTCCGAQRFKMYPPVDQQAWGAFVKTLVSRYRGRVNDFEIGNEPGFTSAFWMTGSPADFAAYLKTAYLAAHEANPDCTIYPGAPLATEFHDGVMKANGGKPYYDRLSVHYLGNGSRFATKTDNWLALNAAYGLERRLVNTEDMSWSDRRKVGQRAVAVSMVKHHVRDAAKGVVRTFAFQPFDDLSGTYSFFDVTDAPYPAFACYRTMTHRLERAKYVGSLSAVEYEAYVFDRQGTPVIVYWNALKVPYRVKLPLGVATAVDVDAMDNETRVVAGADGSVALEAGDLPRYVEGGDWGTLRRAIAATPRNPFLGAGGNPLGRNLAHRKIEKPTVYRGRHFFDVAKDVPVRYGETYLFAAKISGKGELHGIYTICDKRGKEIFPCRQGLNCLGAKGESAERTVTDVISIAQEEAASLKLVLVPNFYTDKEASLTVRDVTVARISDTYTASKALHQGTFGRTAFGAPIAIEGATACVQVTDNEVGLRFDIEDATYDPPTEMKTGYMKDSVQFALDPVGEGLDRTEFLVGTLKDGGPFVYKFNNYTTPELPDNLTRQGLVKSARVTFEKTAKGYRFDVKLPLAEVYPLKADQKSFGFDFLVNDSDGGDRRYVEWTAGIGGAKDATQYGELAVENHYHR